MKVLILNVLFAFALNNATAQKCGENNLRTLNVCETEYLDSAFKSDGIDFEGKRVLFRTNNFGSQELGKVKYFKDVETGHIQHHAVVLTEVEKQQYLNIDADIIVVTWAKIGISPYPKERQKTLKNLDKAITEESK